MEEVLSEGKNFRLLEDSELPDIIEFIGQFLPHSIKVPNLFVFSAHLFIQNLFKSRRFMIFHFKFWWMRQVKLIFFLIAQKPGTK
jgi:hypothetical protein